MRTSDLLRASRIGLLGLGREGLATAAFLRRAGYAGRLDAFVDAPCPAPVDIVVHTSPELITRMDVVVRSPGFAPAHPMRQELDATGVPQATATQIFLREMLLAGGTVIGVTASKGKSTTSTLLHLTLREAGVEAALVGNIGAPALDALDDIIARRAIAVMELSSYQCADLVAGCGPSVALIGALFPEHLDYHGGEQAYYRAKAMIATTQRTGDALYCHRRSLWVLDGLPLRGTLHVVHDPAGLHYADGFFRRGGTRLFPGSDMRLIGDHNRENAVAALAVAERFGATSEHLHRVISRFEGLPYRLQDEGVHAGIRWINDSISTAPDAGAMALRAVGPAARTLIAGGYDRGMDVAPLIDAIAASGVTTVIVLPATGAAIARAIRARALDVHVHEAVDLADAVRLARRHTSEGTTCLFSPSAPSYTFFTDFEERGRAFQTAIRGF